MEAIKWVLKMAKGDLKRILIGVVLTFITTGAAFIYPVIYSHIIDDVIGNGKTELLVPLFSAIVIVALLRSLVYYLQGWVITGAAYNSIKRLRLFLYEKLEKLDQSYYGQNRTGDLMMKLTGDLDWVRHFLEWIVPNVITNIILLVATLSIFFSTSPLLTICSLVFAPVTTFASKKLSKILRPVHDRVREESSRLNICVQENISGNRVVKAFCREDYEIKNFEERNLAYCDAAIESTRAWWRYGPFINGIGSSMTVVLLVLGGIFVINGSITLGQLTLFLNLAWGLNGPINVIASVVNDYQRFMASVEKIMTIYYAQPDIVSPEDGKDASGIQGDIEFKGVSFTASGNEILKDINFRAKAGQTVAIMGPTGSGKTTLISMISRFMDPVKGSVCIDGVDIREYRLGSLRSRIAMAMQDVFLFSDSVDSNIAYGKPDSEDDWVLECSTDADAHSFIKRMPYGYDTIIGERGVGLSGGQRQRLSLARALAYDAPILILDDTTSAVDMETEEYIQSRLKARKRKATTIIIAQRISSVRDADCIYIVEDGRISEYGTHKELLEKKGYYYNIYCLQQGLTEDARAAKAGEVKING